MQNQDEFFSRLKAMNDEFVAMAEADGWRDYARFTRAPAGAGAGRVSVAPHAHASVEVGHLPPSSNHGGKTPPEQVHLDGPAMAHVDWLGLTLPIPEGVENVPSWAVVQLARFGFSCLEDKHKGWFGYMHQHTIDDDCGLIAFGGEAQKNTLHIELTGKGCAVIPSWAELRTWCEQAGAKITRIDLAHDDLSGQTANIGICRQWLTDGLFSMGKRPPRCEVSRGCFLI